MADKLVKEIITTTTERFNDNGSIKEKITETREKVYATNYSEEDVAKAEVVDKETPKKEEAPKPQEKTIEQQIQEAAKAIDSKPKEQEVAQNPYQPPNPYAPPQYNRVATPQNPTKFPWEQ